MIDFIRWVAAMNAGDEITMYIEHRAHVASVSEAWRFLLQEGSELAKRSGVEPHNLILSKFSARFFPSSFSDSLL